MPALCLEPIIPEPPTVSCVSTVPILKKMKVLKRFKKKMGLGEAFFFIFNFPFEIILGSITYGFHNYKVVNNLTIKKKYYVFVIVFRGRIYIY